MVSTSPSSCLATFGSSVVNQLVKDSSAGSGTTARAVDAGSVRICMISRVIELEFEVAMILVCSCSCGCADDRTRGGVGDDVCSKQSLSAVDGDEAKEMEWKRWNIK